MLVTFYYFTLRIYLMSELTLIILFITNLLMLGVGVVIGLYLNKELVREQYIKTSKKIKNRNVEVGPISRPTQTEISKRGTAQERAEKEMEKTFTQLSGFKNNG